MELMDQTPATVVDGNEDSLKSRDRREKASSNINDKRDEKSANFRNVKRKTTKASIRDGPPVSHVVPYLMFVVASFGWSVLEDFSTPWRTLLKCLPVLYLMVYMGVTEGRRGESKKVLPALFFSVFGDALLSYPEIWFLEGVEAFAVAQGLYIAAFGFEEPNLTNGILVYAVGSVLLVFILPHVSTTLAVAFSVYSLLIWTMLWRALDRFTRLRHVMSLEQRLSSVLGASLFILSDSCIVFLQIFELVPKVQARFVIMSTYYSAQLLLMLGSANSFWAYRRSASDSKSE